MKILFLSQIVPYPPHGGVLQRSYNLLREIGKYNEVHLLAFVHPDMLGTQELIAESKEALGRHCVSVQYFPLWPKRSVVHKYSAFAASVLYTKPFSVLAHKSMGYGGAVLDAVRSKAIDLLHIDTIGLAPYRALGYNLPSVLTHHNIESRLLERRAEFEDNVLRKYYVSQQARRMRAYEALQAPLFDINLMMSVNDQMELQNIAPGVVTAIAPNGVDTEYFSPAPTGDGLAAIYTGGMNMFANKDAVLYFLRDIWPAVLHEHPGARFYVIGQDPPKELLDIARRESSVIVTGYVPDVRPYVRRSAVYVVPLRVGGGTRLKVLDALAQGKAIVSTSVGCEGIEVTHGRNILIEDEPTQFAERVNGLFKNRHARHELGAAARDLAISRYSWSTIGANLQKVYELVAKKHSNYGKEQI